ncbi:immunity protein Tsi6 family protein [Pseudoxanthomonas indica]|uniref:Tsi6 domain-containing protein n=1 Tax=Pseudoxanthomonas indica TaxID=428993 RepID=A0A1T5LW87_9GAMM|nr:immunity protein Tsi6 family protein [Pseudoxanthomonas indica]GGD40886.1 hypothetical protein GCM10007235_11150 [Pseudoxanthomonas indica]SKC80231.1 hypothetical protein SAMN06296058_3246 [Pseudoxanthomonas indica]
MKSIDAVQRALALARTRAGKTPGFPLYASCVAQLEYLLSNLDGSVPVDRPKLRTFTIGHYAVREFEESDEELARALKDAYLIASKLADGVKVT